MLVVEYLGVVRKELGFKYQDSIRAAQSRFNETKGKASETKLLSIKDEA